MIETNYEKRKPRSGHRRSSNLKVYNNQHNNVPKSRGGISKALEKYTSLAQDAYSNGDRIVAENYYQYAEHYQRLLNEEFGFDPKRQSQEGFGEKTMDIESENFDDAKPSRTQRAINAKNDRLSNDQSGQPSKHQTNKKESFTSDGIEALKPFESSMNEEKTQSS